MNSVGYFEIQADNPKRAVKFYSEVFDWKFIRQEGMPIEYWRIETEDMNGGLLKRPAHSPAGGQGTNAFVCSIEVANFDTTAEKILKHGGIVVLPKFAVPGKCWQGYFQDSEENTFGIFEVNPNAT